MKILRFYVKHVVRFFVVLSVMAFAIGCSGLFGNPVGSELPETTQGGGGSGGGSTDGGGSSGDGDLVSTLDPSSLTANFPERDHRYRPTSRNRVTLSGRADIFATGLYEYTSGSYHEGAVFTRDTGVREGNFEFASNGAPYAKPSYEKKGLVSDPDGDGRQEMLLLNQWFDPGDLGNQMDDRLRYELHFIDDFSESRSHSELSNRSDIYQHLVTHTRYDGDDDEPDEFDLDNIDIGGDGNDETIIAMANDEDQVKIVLINDNVPGSGGNFGVIDAFSVDNMFAPYYVAVAGAQMDSDTAEEIVLASGIFWSPGSASGTVVVLDDYHDNYAELGRYSGSLANIDLAVGDIDGNGLNEIVLAGITGGGAYGVDILDFDAGAGSISSRDGVNELSSSARNGGSDAIRVEVTNVQGDGVPEIVVNDVILSDLRATAGSISELDEIDDFPGTSANQLNRYDFADHDGDGDDEVFMFRPAGGLQVFEVQDGGGLSATPLYPLGGALYSPSSSGGRGNNILLAGVFEQEGTVVEFKESFQETVWSDPQVIAVIGAPPSDPDLGMSANDSSASIGYEDETGTEGEFAFGVEAYAQVGFEVDEYFTQSGFEWAIAFSKGLELSTMVGRSSQHTVEYATTPEADIVVATMIPFRTYSYEVVDSTVASSAVGTEVLIQEPGDPVLRAIRLDRFVEEAGFNPVEGYFNHNPGEPQTYMSRSEMESLGNDFTVIATTKDSNGNTSARLVPEHPSSISESFALSNYGSTSLTLTQSLNSFTKIKGGTAYVEVGIEYSFSASAAITYGSTAFYSWTVGGMPPEYYDDVNNHFSAGAIFYTHETQSGGGQKFHTLNFWVE